MATDLVGNILLRRYAVEALLGRGGMAEVYRARDRVRGYDLAIKVLREDLAEDREFVRRFRAEARALSQLAHANIVRFYEFEQDGSLAFLVMDFVPGITLRRRLSDANGPLPPAETLNIVRQAGTALAYAHHEGVIHRDVKPGNIMLTPDGRALLSDFGIAKLVDSGTVTTVMPGTPAYMSPEQILGRPLDARTDLYSFGVVIYEIVSGRRPFVGTGAPATESSSTRDQVRWEHLNAAPVDPRRFIPTLPPAVARVIVKSLAKEPTDRWQSATELLAAFENAAAGWAGASRPERVDPFLPVSKPTLDRSTSAAVPQYHPPATVQTDKLTSKNPATALAAAVMIGAFILASVFFAFLWRPTAQPSPTLSPVPTPDYALTANVVAVATASAEAALSQTADAQATETRFAQGAHATQAAQAAALDMTSQALAAEQTLQAEQQTVNAIHAAQTSEALAAESQSTDQAAATQTTGTQQALDVQATAQAFSSWPVFISDSFNDNRNDWQAGNTNDAYLVGTVFVTGGKYRWNDKAKKGFRSTGWPARGSVGDFYAKVDAQIIQGPASAKYGLVFRLVDKNNLYIFRVTDSQTFDVNLIQDDKWETLIDWTATDAIRPGEVNQLAVGGLGSHFNFYIDNQLVGEVDDSRLSKGQVGVDVGLDNAGDEAVFEFDNFELHTP